MSEGWGEGWGAADATQSVRPTSSGDGWGSGAHEVQAGLERPPVLLLMIGLAVAVLGLVLSVIALVLHQFLAAVAAWVLAGPVALGLLAAFVLVEGGRRSRGWYVPAASVPWLRRALVLAALVAVAVSAWTVADLVARG